MGYSWDQFEFATSVYQLRWIFVVVAFLAYITRSRLIFMVGTMGAFLGFFVPEPVEYADFASLEAANMSGLAKTSEHVRYLGIIGATCGCILGAGLRLLFDRHKTTGIAGGNKSVTSNSVAS